MAIVEVATGSSRLEGVIMNLGQGVIRGRVIELAEDPGIEDGREVDVVIRPVPESAAQIAAILRTAGSMAADPEFEANMDEVAAQRHSARFRDPAG